jgi:hypothetical protein
MASESCGGGEGPCEHFDHGIFWDHNGVQSSALHILERVQKGLQPTKRQQFDTAHLISLEALDFDGEKVSITDRGLCCLDWLRRDRDA